MPNPSHLLKAGQHVSANALEEYVTALGKEVNKYLTKDLNYGKAAKRMYNIFRLTGRYEEAAYPARAVR